MFSVNPTSSLVNPSVSPDLGILGLVTTPSLNPLLSPTFNLGGTSTLPTTNTLNALLNPSLSSTPNFLYNPLYGGLPINQSILSMAQQNPSVFNEPPSKFAERLENITKNHKALQELVKPKEVGNDSPSWLPLVTTILTKLFGSKDDNSSNPLAGLFG